MRRWSACAPPGKRVIPITGRPAGWCDHIARMWPVDAVVGENGAFYLRYDARARRSSRKRFLADDATRAREPRRGSPRSRERILAAVPGCALASDQLYREADLAIDFCEDVPPLPRAAVDRIVALMQGEGMTAKVSSIHVNGWFGDYDKLAMTRTLLAEVFGVDLDAERERCAVRRRLAQRRADVRATSRTRSASPTCARSPTGSRRCRPTSPSARAARASPKLPGRCSADRGRRGQRYGRRTNTGSLNSEWISTPRIVGSSGTT